MIMTYIFRWMYLIRLCIIKTLIYYYVYSSVIIHQLTGFPKVIVNRQQNTMFYDNFIQP